MYDEIILPLGLMLGISASLGLSG